MEWASAGGGEFVRVAFGAGLLAPFKVYVGNAGGTDDADFGGEFFGAGKGFGIPGAIGPAGAEELQRSAVLGPPREGVERGEAGREGNGDGCGSENIAVPIDDAAGRAGADGDLVRRERGAALGQRLGGWPGGAGGEEGAGG